MSVISVKNPLVIMHPSRNISEFIDRNYMISRSWRKSLEVMLKCTEYGRAYNHNGNLCTGQRAHME
jgi:hypothetical protein